MAHPRRFRFAAQFHTAQNADAWAAKARKAEDLGYSTLLLPDHFGDQLAPVPAMMAAADATTDLRVGVLVFDNDYKHPVVLAKEVATIDVLSGGRVEFGIGAGWMNTDYEQSGIPQDPPGVRIDRMTEALAVIKGLWDDGPVSFEGRHYRISGLEGLPKPVQRPHPPILIGGGGKRVLSLAAREADLVGINPRLTSGAADAESARDALASRTDTKVAWVREAAGERFDDLELNMLVFAVIVTDDRRAMLEMMAGATGLTPEEASDVPHAWIGTVEEICDQIVAARERWGVSYWIVQGDPFEAAAPVVAKLAGT
ncbi:MAG: TIGR03621 family F420-dependent LLM class oxidoreductase [Acidimicrobiales bacterium]